MTKIVNAFKNCDQIRRNFFRNMNRKAFLNFSVIIEEENDLGSEFELVRQSLYQFVNLITPQSSFIDKRNALELYDQYIIDTNKKLDEFFQNIDLADMENTENWLHQCEQLTIYMEFKWLIFDSSFTLFQACKDKTTLIAKIQENLISYSDSYFMIINRLNQASHRENPAIQASAQTQEHAPKITLLTISKIKVKFYSALLAKLHELLNRFDEIGDTILLEKIRIQQIQQYCCQCTRDIIDCNLAITVAEKKADGFKVLYTLISEYENFYTYVIKTNKTLNSVAFTEGSKQKWNDLFSHYYSLIEHHETPKIKSTEYIPNSNPILDEQPTVPTEIAALDLDLLTPPNTTTSTNKKKKNKKKRAMKQQAATASNEVMEINKESDEDEKLIQSLDSLSTEAMVEHAQDQSTWTTVTRTLKNTHETRIFKALCQVETIHQWQSIQKAIDDQQYQTALAILEAIPKAQQNNEYYKALETCFAGLFRYHDAINAVRNLDVTDRTKVWFTIANYYEKLNEYHAVIYFCNKILAQKPNHKNALTSKALASSQLGLFVDEKNCWLLILATTPNDKTIQDKLAQCQERLEATVSPKKSPHALNPKAVTYTPLNSILPPNDIDSHFLELTTTRAIACAFLLINDVPINEAFVVGGAVTSLLNNQNMRPGQDIDIIITNKHLDYMMQNPAFTLSPYILEKGYLFQSKPEYSSIQIDCFIPHQTQDLLATQDRDFCSSAVFVDRNFTIIDPTSRGQKNIDDKILDSIDSPYQCFMADPIRLLRAIYYKLLGYEPTEGLKQAMEQWLPQAPFSQKQQAHFNAVLFKMLCKSQGLEFVQEFAALKLHTKIFGLPVTILNPEALYWELLACTKTYKMGHHRFFNQHEKAAPNPQELHFSSQLNFSLFP